MNISDNIIRDILTSQLSANKLVFYVLEQQNAKTSKSRRITFRIL